jgi:hypothetical protein
VGFDDADLSIVAESPRNFTELLSARHAGSVVEPYSAGLVYSLNGA